jgi:hypothetical protein
VWLSVTQATPSVPKCTRCYRAWTCDWTLYNFWLWSLLLEIVACLTLKSLGSCAL